MKKITGRVVFQCEYCTKVSLSAGGIKLHEVTCKKNPQNLTPCSECKFCEKERVVYDYDGDVIEDLNDYKEECCVNSEDPQYYIRTTFTCLKDGKKMYHNKINRMSIEKRNAIISQCDKMMPQECDEYDNYMELGKYAKEFDPLCLMLNE